VKTYLSPCKLNIGLEVIRRRDDGYHDLNTLFYRLDTPNDTLEVSDGQSFNLSISDNVLPADSKNLIVRAIHLAAQMDERDMPNLHIHLEKKLPMGAGIGGGSGNAATALNIYSDHVRELSPKEKMSYAKWLGADVSFFTSGMRAAIGSGIGDELREIDFEIKNIILLAKLKDISIPTADAYANVILNENRTPTDIASVVTKPLSEWKNHLVNDFEPYAFEQYPDLAEVKQMMYDSGARFSMMSGSGSLIYGIFENIEHSKAAALEILGYYRDAWVAAHLPE
jgi:4-diphosphocytidyl-2-C-methyl-D-erythritol kinase